MKLPIKPGQNHMAVSGPSQYGRYRPLVTEFCFDRSQQLLGLLNECSVYVVQGSRGCSELANQGANLRIIDRILVNRNLRKRPPNPSQISLSNKQSFCVLMPQSSESDQSRMKLENRDGSR